MSAPCYRPNLRGEEDNLFVLDGTLIKVWARLKSYRLTGGKKGKEIGRPGIRVVAQREVHSFMKSGVLNPFT